MEKMGFETDRRLAVDYKNQPVDVSIDGVAYHFSSLLEYRWAQYLEFLRLGREIDNWGYENKDCKFRFADSTYTVDFVTYHSDGHMEFYETKGNMQQPTIRKFRTLQKYYPDTIIYLVVNRVPKKYRSLPSGLWKRGRRRTNLYASAEKYTSRIIEADPIFKKLGRCIDMSNPGQTAQAAIKSYYQGA